MGPECIHITTHTSCWRNRINIEIVNLDGLNEQERTAYINTTFISALSPEDRQAYDRYYQDDAEIND